MLMGFLGEGLGIFGVENILICLIIFNVVCVVKYWSRMWLISKDFYLDGIYIIIMVVYIYYRIFFCFDFNVERIYIDIIY